jgi:hypothetical protein
MAKWCDQGETSVGNVYLKGATRPAFYLGLYKNTTEPAEDAAMTSITEPTIGVAGYARILLGDGDWTEGAAGVFTNLEKTFTAAGGNWGDVYGYFVTTQATGTAGLLICAEQFTTPVPPLPMNNGWNLTVTPRITVS